EGGGGTARSGVEHGDVFEEGGDVIEHLRTIAAVGFLRPGPGGEVVPAGAARGLRVRGDHANALLREVAPVLDTLRVALADDEDDRGGVGGAVLGKFGLPVLRKQLGFAGDDVDVPRERECDD